MGIRAFADKPADADNFYTSPEVARQKVSFPNQYALKVAGNLYLPQGLERKAKYAAIIVGHPMSAVKEQSANLVRHQNGRTRLRGPIF